MTAEPQQEGHVPTGVELTALDERFRADPYPVLDELRESEPVHHDEVVNRWVLTRHDDVVKVINDRSLSQDPRNAADGTYMSLYRTQLNTDDGDYQPSILFLDAPDHTRLRGLVTKAFTPRAVERMRPRIQEIVDELLDAVADQDGFDLMDAFAMPLPTVVIAEMLGVNAADQADFKRWSDESILSFNPMISDEERERANAAFTAMDEYLAGAVGERRETPGDDLISSMIAVEEAGDQLTNAEIVTMTSLLLTAGNVTTTDLIGNGVHALLEYPDELQKLRDDLSLIKNTVEEILRYDSPIVQTVRVTLSDTNLEGCPVSTGQSVVPLLAAANHDPAVYPDPHRFDVTREDIHHQSFGGGVHYCLGAPLARLEAEIGIGTLVQRFPNLRAADEPLEWRKLPSFRGLIKLPVLIG